MTPEEYEFRRLSIETNDTLERKVMDYARGKAVRVPRARRQLIEKGLAIVETGIPEMTEEERRAFQEELERLYSLIRKKQKRR